MVPIEFPDEKLDVLAIGPHRDDLELACGGTILRLCDLGHTVGMVDMTAGEMGTRGDADERNEECICAAHILGVNYRVNLGLPDGKLRDTDEAQDRLIRVIRATRPSLILCPFPEDYRHPDHAIAGQMIPEAAFRSGFPKWETGQPHHRPLMSLRYMLSHEFEPNLVVDVSDYWERKMEAVRCYRSQVFVADTERKEEETYISRPEFYDRLDARYRFFGGKIATTYGEPFWVPGPLRIDDPMSLTAGSIEGFAQRANNVKQ
jgi:N-acetylglucosamine malate deacetylase 1